jgi:hypothetical protein
MTSEAKQSRVYNCPHCKSAVEYDETADLYQVVADHLAICKNPPRQSVAIYEASTGSLADVKLRFAAAQYARKVGLLPELGHICLYHGRPWVTIDGWFYRFRKRYPSGHVYTRALTQDEREGINLDEKIQAWKAEAFDTPKGDLLSVGYGYASEGDDPLALKSAVEPRWPWRLAEKRAEEDCLRKAVPLDLEGVKGE